MSMIGNYLRVSGAKLEHLLEDPANIRELLYPQDGKGEHPDGMHLDIDKSWHAIQFLLTGEPFEGDLPLQNAVMGGVELGEEDVGYGPARGISPAEVQEVSRALGAISGDGLWSRFDANAFAGTELYPGKWSADDKDYIVDHYEHLRAFFAEAAKAGDAMILYLN